MRLTETTLSVRPSRGKKNWFDRRSIVELPAPVSRRNRQGGPGIAASSWAVTTQRNLTAAENIEFFGGKWPTLSYRDMK
jgi:hypothetical protein